MDSQVLVTVFTVLLTISLSAERLIELGKPLYEKIAIDVWRKSAKLLSAVVIGFFLAILFKFDMLSVLGVGVNPYVGYLAAGLVTSTGSTTINRLLDWLKSLDNKNYW